MLQKRDRTHIAAKVRRAVRAMADNPEDCGGALLISFELAAFLSWHSWRDEGWGERGWSCGGREWVGERSYLEGGKRSSLFIFI